MRFWFSAPAIVATPVMLPPGRDNEGTSLAATGSAPTIMTIGISFVAFAATVAAVLLNSRYLPIVIYEKGRPENAAFVANKMEGGEHQNHPFWTPAFHPETWGSLDAASRAV
jgi:hypothetical protein